MARSPRWKHISIPLPDDGLKMAIVADTHSKPHPDAYRLITERRPHHILHGGDIGDLSVLDDLAKLAPLTAVRGNIDETTNALPDFVSIHFTKGGVTRSCWLLTHIAVRGPKLMKPVLEMAKLKNAQLVVCGHSHVPLLVMDRGIAVFNPGSIGPRRFHLPITFGMITISDGGLSFEHISCETGQRWSPQASTA